MGDGWVAVWAVAVPMPPSIVVTTSSPAIRTNLALFMSASPCWGIGGPFPKLLSRSLTLIGDYEKASQHRLCKNEQTGKYRTNTREETLAAPILHSAA
jgi:hypothetical protein